MKITYKNNCSLRLICEFVKATGSLGRTGLGAVLLFAGPIGWVVGGTVGLTEVIGVRNNFKAVEEAYHLADKNLKDEDIQSKWI